MELRDYVRVLKARVWLIVAATVVTIIVAVVVSFLQTPLYEAEANLLITESNSSSAALDAALAGFSTQPERGLQTQVRMLKMRPAFERTIRRLDLRMHPDELQNRTEIVAEGQTNVISIRVQDENPETAARIANALAEEYALWVREFSRARIRAAATQVEQQLDEVRSELVEIGGAANTKSDRDRMALQIAGEDYAGLSEQLRQLRIREEMEVGPVQVVNSAAVPEGAFSPRPVRNGILAAIVGLAFGLGVAFAIEALDTTVKNPEQVADLTASPVLGVVPMQRIDPAASIVLDETASNPVAEAIRGIRHSLDFINFDGRIRTMLITSAAPGEGKSTVATNLAVGLARTGRKVALVSVDFHRPKSATYLGLSEALGLSHVLTGQYGLEVCLQQVGEDGLLVLASGKVPPNPSELLSSDRMGEVLAQLEKRVDWVILDGPPVLAVADTTAVTKWADGTLVVVRAGKTHRDALERAVGMLNGVGAKLLGAVLVGVPETGSGAGTYGYSSYAYRRRSS